MRIGYVVLNHRPPAQLSRLLGRISREQETARVVVHHDRFRADLDADELTHVPNLEILTSQEPLSWGDFSIVEACWSALAVLARHPDVDWFVLLSAQDYPIKSLRQLEQLFSETASDAFLECAPMGSRPPEQRRILEYRYLYQYLTPRNTGHLSAGRLADLLADGVNLLQPYVHVYKYPEALPNRWGWRTRCVPFTDGFLCWHSSMWMALSRRAVVSLLEYTEHNERLVSYFRRTAVPDEAATATVLCNQPDLNVESRSLHFIRWTDPHSGHPDILDSADLPAMLASDGYFGRKFDPATDEMVLDELDAIPQVAAQRSRPEESDRC